MKKLLVTSLMSLTAALAFGQGTVYFANDSTTLPTGDRLIRFEAANTIGNVAGVAGAPAVGANFYVDLYYKAGVVTDPSLLTMANRGTTQSKLRASTTSTPGVWTGAGYVTLDGVPFGSGPVTLQVKAWDSAGGANYAACNTAKGASALFTYTMPSSGAAPASDFFMNNFAGFNIANTVVPEPSTFALAGLGAAAMLIFRRRK